MNDRYDDRRGKPPADDRLFEVRNIDDIIKLKLRFVLS